jgi:hypothetical protein
VGCTKRLLPLPWLLAAAAATAAPLDALLSALPDPGSGRGRLELSVEHANRSLDPFPDDAVDPTAPRAPPGSYRGLRASGAYRVLETLTLSATLGQRRLDDGVDVYRFDSWQLAGQWQVAPQRGRMPALALRLAAWGNHSDATESHTPVQVPGAVLNSVKITRPTDRNLQLDLIGTWRLSPAWDLSAVLGVGRTQLGYGSLSATSTINGCQYDLRFNGNDIFGQLAGPCSAAGGIIRQFYDSSGDYGVDVPREIAWHGDFAQLAVNAVWRSGAWTVQGGYLFHTIHRASVDAIAAGRGNPVQRINHVFALDAGLRVHEHLTVFVRAQRSSRLFFHELPVIYNSSTSGSFGQHFTVLTLGLRAGF